MVGIPRSVVRRSWLPSLYLLAPLLWLFRRALFQGEIFAYRDSAHFYFPLYRYVQNQWRDGLPLWNPLDGLGQPLLGDPTAAVWYPGKLLFLLPCPYALCFALYVVVHLWIGGYGAFRLARSCRANWHGSLVAGLCYELSGQVLFQYCNPIYCVGAAWFPWALMFLHQILGANKRRSLAMLSITLSLMVLGGDPHAAYYVLAMGLLWVCLSARAASRIGDVFWQLAKLGGVAASVVLLCAAQCLPTLEWTRLSDRNLRDGPRSLVELSVDVVTAAVSDRPRPSLDLFWVRSSRESHDRRIYDFSVGVWRWPELLWPNVSGLPFPTHQRWLSGFPGEARTWTPSLYLGLLPLFLAFCRFRLWGGRTTTRWWSWAVLISALGAVGCYGLGWLYNEFLYLTNPAGYQESKVLPGLGGVYWLMNVLLPGHVGFRYPAKLWTVTTLSVGLLAAKGWPSWRATWCTTFCRRSQIVAAISVVLALIVCTPAVRSALGHVPANPLFGPLDPHRTQLALLLTFLHTAVVCGAMASCRRLPSRAVSWSLLSLMLLELTFAQAKLVQTIAPVTPSQPLGISAGDVMYRCKPALAYPQAWRRVSSPRRFVELQENDLTTVMPKHHLSLGARSIQSSVAMTCADSFALAEVAREVGYESGSGFRIPHRAWADLLGANHLLTNRKGFLSEQELRAVRTATSAVRHVRNPRAYPRVWLVHDWTVHRGSAIHDYQSLLQRTRQVMLEHGEFRDFRQRAVVEDVPSVFPVPPSYTATTDACERIAESSHLLAVTATTAAPGILILADQYYPGWEVWVAGPDDKWLQHPLLRVNRVMRGVYLDAGHHRIEFRYRPRTVTLGIWTSVIAWIALAGWSVGCRLPSQMGGDLSERLGVSPG